jgi:hypothetical protein
MQLEDYFEKCSEVIPTALSLYLSLLLILEKNLSQPVFLFNYDSN